MDTGRPFTVFESQYARLNSQQQEAVDTIDGPVMVIAGPGTGKTQVLALRIANILLKTDAAPHNVLALTFTDSASKNMRDRLASFIGPAAYQVEVKTFHSFCEEVIRSHPEFFPIDRDSEPMDDIERFEVLRELLKNPDLRALRTPASRYHYIKDIQKDIADLKKEGVSPDAFDLLVEREKEWFEANKDELKKVERTTWESLTAKHRELALLYRQYQEYLSTHHRYDFEDMIIETVKAFQEHEVLLLEYQERFQYILVDEYQDTNSAQNTVVDLLASYWGEQANLFVVGDPHQTVYRFQGASMENTLGFINRYKHAVFITLGTGYRCTQPIYDAAAALISHNPESNSAHSQSTIDLTHALVSVSASTQPLLYTISPNTTYELVQIAQDIALQIESGVSPAEIAILCKKNSQCEEIAAVLALSNVPHVTERSNDVLESVAIQQLLSLLRVIQGVPENTENTSLFDVLNFEWTHLDPLLVMKLTRATGKSRTYSSIYDLVRAGFAHCKTLSGCEDITPLEFATIESFFDRLVAWKAAESTITFSQWVVEIMNESGFLTWVEHNQYSQEYLEDISSLYAQIQRWNTRNRQLTLTECLLRIDAITQHRLSIPRQMMTGKTNSVTVCTVHKAKGREWNHVYIPMLCNGNWGNTRQPAGIPLPDGILKSDAHMASQKNSDGNEDERRLLYVALTRAKTHVHLSRSQTDTSSGKLKDLTQSQFIEELPQDLLSITELEPTPEEILRAHTTLLTAPSKTLWRDDQRAWLQELVSTFELSVSALNAYLESPQKFYREHLLKVPTAPTASLAFGTAIHAALEWHYRHLKIHDGVHPHIEKTITVFKDALKDQLLTPEDLAIRLRLGEESLRSYLTNRGERVIQVLTTEEGFGWKRGKILLDDISLTGKIDRIDIVDLQENTIRLIDYKTGKQKTVGEIEGRTLSANISEREQQLPESVRGRMKRQLLFYKLLLSLDRQYKHFRIHSAVFDFVSPHKGECIERSFDLRDSDLEDLKMLIRQVMKEIRELAFLEHV